ASTPFLFFCDFQTDLARAVTEGRRAEFGRSAQFSDEKLRASIPDPNAEATFLSSKLDWSSVHESKHQEYLDFYTSLLQVRRQEIVPMLNENDSLFSQSKWSIAGTVLKVCWHSDAKALELHANLSDQPVPWVQPAGRSIYKNFDLAGGEMGPWSVAWYVNQ